MQKANQVAQKPKKKQMIFFSFVSYLLSQNLRVDSRFQKMANKNKKTVNSFKVAKTLIRLSSNSNFAFKTYLSKICFLVHDKNRNAVFYFAFYKFRKPGQSKSSRFLGCTDTLKNLRK